MQFEEAMSLFSKVRRHELRDFAFGDCEITFTLDDNELASGYFSSGKSEVNIWNIETPVKFTGKQADQLRKVANIGSLHRNDELS